jgi:hypothetical protein
MLGKRLAPGKRRVQLALCTGWGRSQVKWCAHHPYAFYHSQKTYSICREAARLANPGNDECHVWGFLLAIVGLPEGALPAASVSVLKALGVAMAVGC